MAAGTRQSEGREWSSASMGRRTSRGLSMSSGGGKLGRDGSHPIEPRAEQELCVEPCARRVVAVGGELVEGQVATLSAQVAALTKQVAELMEKLGRNSRNSHLPPSSDGPGQRGPSGQGKANQGTRKRGGQPGHGGSRRTLLPPDEVDDVVD